MHLRMFHRWAATYRVASLSGQCGRSTAGGIAGLRKRTGRFWRATADRIRIAHYVAARLTGGRAAADGVEIVMNANRLARAREQ
jgi:hypothetical protein